MPFDILCTLPWMARPRGMPSQTAQKPIQLHSALPEVVIMLSSHHRQAGDAALFSSACWCRSVPPMSVALYKQSFVGLEQTKDSRSYKIIKSVYLRATPKDFETKSSMQSLVYGFEKPRIGPFDCQIAFGIIWMKHCGFYRKSSTISAMHLMSTGNLFNFSAPCIQMNPCVVLNRPKL